MMNILWFSLSPCGSLRMNNNARVIQGWMISLEDEVKKLVNVKLSVSYISSEEKPPFEYDGVNYFPVCRKIPQNGMKRVLARLKSYRKQDEEILPKLLNVVRTIKPDLIHIHGTEECFGLIQDVVKDIPIVFSIQGLIAPYKEKYFSGMPYHEVKRYEPVYKKIRQLSVVNDYKSFCYRAERENGYLSKAKYVFGRTFWDKDCTLALNLNRKYYVVNEILRNEFYQKRWNKTKFDSRLKLVSTISGGIYKGYETVLKTCRLLSEYSGVDYEWHIAGYDKNSKWVKIAEKITKVKLTDYPIVFHGRINADKLSDLLLSSDIYVHVSHIENSPNSVCEAMILGMPVIASYAGGTVSLLHDGEEGILVQDGDPYVLAGTIIDLWQNQDIAIKIGTTARDKALYRHDKNKIVNELVNGYQMILDDFSSKSNNNEKIINSSCSIHGAMERKQSKLYEK